MKNIWTRRYEGRRGLKKLLKYMRDNPVELVESLTAVVGVAVAGVGLFVSHKKQKKNEVNYD